MEHKVNLYDYSAFHSIEDAEEYEYSYDASGYVVGCRVIRNKADDCDVDSKSESSVDFTKNISESEYGDLGFPEEVEQPLQMGSDDNISYEYDASGYFVGCRVKNGCETEVVQIDSTFYKDDASGCNDDAKSESSVKFVPKYSLFDHNSGPEYVIVDSDDEVEQLSDKGASFDHDTDNLSYSFDASGYFVGCRVKKGCESEEVQSDAAKCSESGSGDSVELSSDFPWLYDIGENQVEEIQEIVSDNFDIMLNNIVSEEEQPLRPNLKRKAADVEFEERRIVSCLMAGQDCPWRDSKGQLGKRAKSLKH